LTSVESFVLHHYRFTYNGVIIIGETIMVHTHVSFYHTIIGECNEEDKTDDDGFTQRSTTLSSKVNSHHAFNFKALCSANLVT
jgi:hypothetical protein